MKAIFVKIHVDGNDSAVFGILTSGDFHNTWFIPRTPKYNHASPHWSPLPMTMYVVSISLCHSY